MLRGRREYLGHEPFAAAGDLRAGYRRLADDRILCVPELTDRRALERGAAEETQATASWCAMSDRRSVWLERRHRRGPAGGGAITSTGWA